MSVLFNHACRYEFFDRNPIHLVRQGAKRHTAPTIVMPAEIKALSNGLALFGLKWGDIDFAPGTMASHAPSCNGVVGPCKTESSQKPVPIHPILADSLGAVERERSTYIKPDDWVFASKRYRGRQIHTSSSPACRNSEAIRMAYFSGTRTRLCCEVWGRSSRLCRSCCGIRPSGRCWMSTRR